MDPITLDALTEIVAIIIAFLTTIYGLSQRAAKQISHNESATFAREVRQALEEESDEGSDISSKEALKLIAFAAEAFSTSES